MGSTVILPLAGCGGNQTQAQPSLVAPSDVSGAWKFVLSENQAQVVVAAHSSSANVDSNPTEIAISLEQSNGILNATGSIYSGNTGCSNPSGWWWYGTGPYSGGNWGSGTFGFQFASGLVSGNTVSIMLTEAMSFQGGQATQSGNLKLLGTVQQDGTMSGTLTDGCILDSSGNPSSQTFTAKKISIFPPTSWP